MVGYCWTATQVRCIQSRFPRNRHHRVYRLVKRSRNHDPSRFDTPSIPLTVNMVIPYPDPYGPAPHKKALYHTPTLPHRAKPGAGDLKRLQPRDKQCIERWKFPVQYVVRTLQEIFHCSRGQWPARLIAAPALTANRCSTLHRIFIFANQTSFVRHTWRWVDSLDLPRTISSFAPRGPDEPDAVADSRINWVSN